MNFHWLQGVLGIIYVSYKKRKITFLNAPNIFLCVALVLSARTHFLKPHFIAHESISFQ